MAIVYIIFLPIYASPTLLFLCLCTLLGIWLAIGRTHVLIRMPLFLVGALALGLVPCLAANDVRPDRFLFIAESGQAVAYGFGLTSLAVSFDRTTPMFIRIPAIVFGSLMTIGLVCSEMNSLDSDWIVRVALATSFLAGVVGALRLFGFRLVNLTDGVSNQEMDKKTGRELDEWLAILHDAHAESLKHAGILALLRGYGLEYSWQKTVTIAYERALGRRAIGETADGNLQLVTQEADPESTDWLNRWTQPRFTIMQWMLFIFCVACLLGYLRAFSRFQATSDDLKYILPLTIGVSVFSLPALFGCLAVRYVRQKVASVASFALVTATGVLFAMGFNPNHPAYIALWILQLAFAGLLILSLILVRNHGYRLVRVETSVSIR